MLQGLWRYQIARGIDWSFEDPAAFQQRVEGLEVADVLNAAITQSLAALNKGTGDSLRTDPVSKSIISITPPSASPSR